MTNFIGIKQIFFGSLTANNTAPKKELNNFPLLNKPTADTVSFGMAKTTYIKFKTLKKMAEILKLPDFYTGEKFSDKYLATIEHIIPQGKTTRNHAIDIGLNSVNSLGNVVPAGRCINNKRGSINLKSWYEMHPDFIEKSQQALKEYERIKLKPGELFEGSSPIDGKEWVQSLKKTLNTELGRVAFQGKNVQKAKDNTTAQSFVPLQNLSYKA